MNNGAKRLAFKARIARDKIAQDLTGVVISLATQVDAEPLRACYLSAAADVDIGDLIGSRRGSCQLPGESTRGQDGLNQTLIRAADGSIARGHAAVLSENESPAGNKEQSRQKATAAWPVLRETMNQIMHEKRALYKTDGGEYPGHKAHESN